MYLYVFKNGQACQTETAPNTETYEEIKKGHVFVWQICEDGKHFERVFADGHYQNEVTFSGIPKGNEEAEAHAENHKD